MQNILNDETFLRWFSSKTDADGQLHTVIPLRVSSIVGARMLKVLNYEIDFVYVDSAHEAGETFMELMLYHDVLHLFSFKMPILDEKTKYIVY